MNLRQVAMVFTMTVLFTGCATFNRDWQRVAATPSPANEIAGAWDGNWRSDRNGHQGRLRCLISRGADGRYDARFRARFWKIFAAGYSVKLDVQREGEGFRFHGKEDLGWLGGGTYEYDGTATATNFLSTYRSKRDHGTFRMHRP